MNPSSPLLSIVITATIDLEPAKRAETLESAQPLIEAALAEAGCRAYTWSFDTLHPGRVHVFEEWADEASLQAHFDGTPYAEMRDHLGASGLLAAVSAKYRVDVIEPVYDAQGVPRADFFTA